MFEITGKSILAGAVEAARRDPATDPAPYPLKGTVTRALRRDAGIIAVDHTRAGYHVSGGKTTPARIFCDVDDCLDACPPQMRAAADLASGLAAAGWDAAPDGATVIVLHVPNAAERRQK